MSWSSRQVGPCSWPPLQWCPLAVWFCPWFRLLVWLFLLWVSEIKLELSLIISDEFSEESTWSSSFCLMSPISFEILSLYFLRCWASALWSQHVLIPPKNKLIVIKSKFFKQLNFISESQLFYNNPYLSWSQPAAWCTSCTRWTSDSLWSPSGVCGMWDFPKLIYKILTNLVDEIVKTIIHFKLFEIFIEKCKIKTRSTKVSDHACDF